MQWHIGEASHQRIPFAFGSLILFASNTSLEAPLHADTIALSIAPLLADTIRHSLNRTDNGFKGPLKVADHQIINRAHARKKASHVIISQITANNKAGARFLGREPRQPYSLGKGHCALKTACMSNTTYRTLLSIGRRPSLESLRKLVHLCDRNKAHRGELRAEILACLDVACVFNLLNQSKDLIWECIL